MKYSDEKNIQLIVALMKAHGIRKIITSPGTTNITLIGSLMHDSFFEIYSSVDERSAAYMACGMAEESGEPVVISCTGATASRNYFPGLTEAYYRKLPILAITSTREECKIGHLIDQQIDRSQQPKDSVVCSEHLQIIKDEEDWWDCTIKANRAILALKRHGGGPVHINLPTLYSKNFNIETLPPVRVINRYSYTNELPEIKDRKVAIFIGTHKRMSKEEEFYIDRFCEAYNSVVFCDSCCGYHGKYGILTFGAEKTLEMDLLIHIGEVSCSAYDCRPQEVWRVNEDGELRDTFRKLTNVFEMSELFFFRHYAQQKNSQEVTYYGECKKESDYIYANLNDIPFSNSWIAFYLHDKMPLNSVIHLGIVSSFFAWNRFPVDKTINRNCNQGGFGIDGNISTMVGASLIHSDKLYFCILGDLAFFYDMNVLGNRHIGRNIRILLVNNGRGVIFRKPSNLGSIFSNEADSFMAAAGHFGNKSPNLVKNYAENLGFKYISAATKEEFIEKSPLFIDPEIGEKPILFEVFVEMEDEILGDSIKNGLKGFKKKVHDLLGPERYNSIKKILKKKELGNMRVDYKNNGK